MNMEYAIALANVQASQLKNTLDSVYVKEYMELIKDIQCRLGILVEKLTRVEIDNAKQ